MERQYFGLQRPFEIALRSKRSERYQEKVIEPTTDIYSTSKIYLKFCCKYLDR